MARAAGLEGGSAVNVIISRYRDVIRVLQDHEGFSSAIAMAGPMSPAPVHVDPPEHARFRELLKPRLSRQGVGRLEPFVRSKVNRLIDAFEAQQRCEFQKDFAVPLPCSVVLHLMGVPAEDLDLLLSIKDQIIHPQAGKERAHETRRHGAVRAGEYFGKALDERMALPADDLLTDLAKAVADGRFTREETLRICLNLVLGGLGV